MDLSAVGLRHFIILDKLSSFRCQFFFLRELTLVGAQFVEIKWTPENFVFCSFNFPQMHIGFLSHEVSVTPHQHSGMWTIWSGSAFSFILVCHSFAARSPNFDFCAISRHLCWHAFMNSRRFFHTLSFALLIFILWSYIPTPHDYFIAKNLDIKVESP